MPSSAPTLRRPPPASSDEPTRLLRSGRAFGEGDPGSMTFEDASRWCLEHDAQLSTEKRASSFGYATLTLSAYGLSISDSLPDDSWRTWADTLVRLVARLQSKMPRA